MKVSTLKLNPGNPRQIKGERLDLLKRSITEFEQMMSIRPIIVDESNTVLGGNMRLQAIKALGRKEIPDEWVKRVDDLTEEQKREFIIKDNAGFGEWDWDLLANDWDDLPLADWGVDVPDFGDGVEAETVDAEPQIDRAAELNEKWKVETGDLWQIGEHRLLCGDSTVASDVGKVLNQGLPGICVTDPPYGVEYDANWRTEAKYADGRLLSTGNDRAIGKVTNDNCANWQVVWELFPGDVIYSYHPPGGTSIVHGLALQAAGFEIRMQLIWAKNQFPIGRGDYHVKHEPIWYAVRKGKTSQMVDDRTQHSLWEIDKPVKSETGHSTQKPLECMAKPIRNHLFQEVYEPFAGSGTTLVACQNLNRQCYAVEISPNYCAVILERMQTAFPELEIKRIESAKEHNA